MMTMVFITHHQDDSGDNDGSEDGGDPSLPPPRPASAPAPSSGVEEGQFVAAISA